MACINTGNEIDKVFYEQNGYYSDHKDIYCIYDTVGLGGHYLPFSKRNPDEGPESVRKADGNIVNKKEDIHNGHITCQLVDIIQSGGQVSVEFKGKAVSIEVQRSFQIIAQVPAEVLGYHFKIWQLERSFIRI